EYHSSHNESRCVSSALRRLSRLRSPGYHHVSRPQYSCSLRLMLPPVYLHYLFGYLPDIGIEPPDSPMDFHSWFEAYLGGHWYTFDARHNTPRIGRILIAHGRDATDVSIVTSFGPHTLVDFNVVTDGVIPEEAVPYPSAGRIASNGGADPGKT